MVIKHKTENKLIKFGHFMQNHVKNYKSSAKYTKNTIIIQNPLVKIVQNAIIFCTKLTVWLYPNTTNKEDL